ncbi:FAD-dependent oxidoreductase [Oceanospirillum sediminis]|uniref:FAD-dependent oxidoreductase n=1 Tax=Oceanospirillum sediminis TaxID=2760088 RepID=A0A839IL84_9GAMM|nr:FAD-dependent oxidoreductase [Oceanospirillum sediminis]MBB1485975.1 FAD-dependent oxidoreductase [Oceanospirillum sediminis]
MSLTIAIIGSGPSGFYLAEILSRKLPESWIDIIERLPVPYGLVRAGVAPDHIGTKNTIRQFERTLNNERIRFIGNLELGKDLSYEELKSNYDRVILATGAYKDRKLNIPGTDCEGIFGSAQFTGWYNGHPDHAGLSPELSGRTAVIIGNGNVALDIARILAKTEQELIEADIPAHARNTLTHTHFSDIWIVGRRGPAEASFTPYELEELGQLHQCTPLTNDDIPDTPSENTDPREARSKQKNLEVLQSFATNKADKPVRLHFLFNHTPVRVISAQGRINELEFQSTDQSEDGENLRLPTDILITAIGYHSEMIPGIPWDTEKNTIKNQDGYVEPGVYTSGWCKRGPNGVIPANKADALSVAKRLLADLEEQAVTDSRPGPEALDKLIKERGIPIISKADWFRIDQEEIARADSTRPREKFISLDEIHSFLQSVS